MLRVRSCQPSRFHALRLSCGVVHLCAKRGAVELEGHRVWGLGFSFLGFGFWVLDFGFWVLGKMDGTLQVVRSRLHTPESTLAALVVTKRGPQQRGPLKNVRNCLRLNGTDP